MSEESKMLSEPVEATPTLRVLTPCIRPRSENAPKRESRKVSFPEEESMLVTGYLEPANPWEYGKSENVSLDDVISTYKASCEKHGTSPIPQILEQLQKLDLDADRNECLNLKGELLCSIHCETLEEVLKRIQFKNINLEGTSLDDEGSVALFDMVEYYESATHLNISSNKNIGYSVKCVYVVAAALKLNSGLRELYLADNNLGVTDAIQLGGLLRSNFTLQLLDISNNNIQDTGLGHISDGLMEQTPSQSGSGLSILVLWNNHLTRNASKHFARAVRIDLRDNCLKVAGLMALALSMKVNTSVTQLDLDSEPKKKEEKDINLEQYRNLVSEIRGYCSRNETAAREEEDTVVEGPTTGTPTRGRLMSATSRKISLTCETLLRTTAMPPQPIAPDGSLLTEPRRSSGRLRSPAPSPIPSPVSSPVPSPSRTRFQVSRVAESSPFLSAGQSGSPTSTSSSPITPPSLSSSPSRFFPSPSTSRFRVTLVEPSSSPTVTSPSGNITVGFNYRQNAAKSSKHEKPSLAAASSVQDVKKSAPEIVVTSIPMIQQTTTSQNVKITVKLEPDSDNLIIENESIPSAVSDTSEDREDREVQSIMDQDHLNDQKSWVTSSIQDSVTLLRRAGRGFTVEPEKESAHLPSSKPVEQSLVIQPTQVDSNISKDCISDIRNNVVHDSSSSNSVDGNAVQNVFEEKKDDTSQNSIKQSETVENNTKSAPPSQRSRKISWIAPANPEEPKSSLEKLLGLFHNPGSFFNKTHQQYKATTAIVNQRPVANSNTTFLLGSVANGDSGQMSSGSQGRSCSESEQSKDLTHNPVTEAKTSSKQSPVMLQKDRQTTNCENPIPDIINNNNKLEDLALGASTRACSEHVSDDGNKCISRHCEDENYNVPKSFEAVLETKVCDANGTKSPSQAVNVRSFQPPSESEGAKETFANKCDSKCNQSSKQESEGCVLVEDISAGIKAMSLSDESNADKSHMSVEQSWSQSCESSYVRGSATTVRLVGGASGFDFPPVDSEKEEASGLPLPELCGVYVTFFINIGWLNECCVHVRTTLNC
ncbi:hypothetical protein C0J52_15882 [Blattella germanica]|nr:hypothetical protein C0J52_15882 [Blattella germanica]